MKRDKPVKKRQPAPGIPAICLAMIFLSGFAALVYQILWMRQLGLVFGNTAHAAAMTLAVFFGGLALGSWFWGRLSPRISSPMRSYVWLELGIGAAGLLCLPVLHLYRGIYPSLHGSFDGAGLLAIKALLAVAMVLPPAFLMGGTIPVLGRWLIRHPSAFGATTARIYGMNTLGAAAGAFAAAFLMLPELGFFWSCLTAVGISIIVAALAWTIGRSSHSDADETAVTIEPAGKESPPPLSRPIICLLAFASGFNVLALEVLWTRMFAQVHENSVYSFAAVLIVVLLSLAAGAWLASRLSARVSGPMPALLVLTVVGGLAVSIVPFSFMALTDDLQMLPQHASFGGYVLQLFATAFGAIGPTCLLLGTVFPFLMKAEERFAAEPGKSIGMLTAINTLGAIIGSLVCGFLLLEWIGLWRAMQVLAALYLVLALVIPTRGQMSGIGLKALSVILLFFSLTILNPGKLPATGMDPDEGRQEVVEQWEDSDATVTVVKKANGEHAIRINSNYSLGSSEAYMSQIYQTRVPLLAFPQVRSVFFLGLGTGMTAGEALDQRDFPNIEKVVVCELSPSVVTAAYQYFGGAPGSPDLTNGLFKDPRATVLVEDGRNHLLANEDRYDMINADLFLPYRSGSGSLYSLEHFRTVRERLTPGGVFVQWLPLYQMSELEFGIISRTLLEVFDRVSVWRCHFKPGGETIALIGHNDNAPVPACELDAGEAMRQAVRGADSDDLPRVVLPINSQTIPLFYCGNLSGIRERFDAYPLNTDDRPIIEFGTPRSLHRNEDGKRPHFVGDAFADLVDEMLAATPPQDDSVLAARTPEIRHLPVAGAAFQRAWLALANSDSQALERHWEAFRRSWLTAAGD